jgi:antitoxin HicB
MLRHYSASLGWSDEDAAYVATCPEFPGLSGVGASAEEALGELREAMEMAFDTYREEGWELPSPRSVPAYSGQLRLRMPKSLHASLASEAEADGVSLNTLAVSLLASGLGQRRTETKLCAELGQIVNDLHWCVAKQVAFKQAATASATSGMLPQDVAYSQPPRPAYH